MRNVKNLTLPIINDLYNLLLQTNNFINSHILPITVIIHAIIFLFLFFSVFVNWNDLKVFVRAYHKWVVRRSCDIFIYVYNITICMIGSTHLLGWHVRSSFPVGWDLVGNRMTQSENSTGNCWWCRTIQIFLHFAMNLIDYFVSTL